MVWEGSKVTRDDQWLTTLSAADIATLIEAVQHTHRTGKPIAEELIRHDFALGPLGDRLLALRDQVLNGCGYVVLRGLPADKMNDEDLIRAYWGIGTFFGDPVSQNAAGHLLGHVIDQRQPPSASTRIYQTSRAQPFHSDSCDIVGLLCLRQAKSGGGSAIASAAAIHNYLLEHDPAALQTLYDEFQCDRYGEIPAGKLPHYTVRVYNRIANALVCCGMDPDIRSAQRLENVKPLSSDQLHALDQFQAVARSLALNMTLKRGDIQLVNNLTVVLARDEFTDHQASERRRYMVRLWLSSPLGRQVPEFLVERWGNIEVGSVRGGIKVPGAVTKVNLNPGLV
jgi:hypothetical protein